MGMGPNEAGKTYIANVSITEAVAFDPEHNDPEKPETWDILDANDFDKDIHNHMKFYCPCCLDKSDKVRLKNPSGGHFQNISFDVINPKTGEFVIDKETNQPKVETRRYWISPRFTLFPHEKHSCDLGTQQNDLSQSIKNHGGVVLKSDSHAYIVNLNIPAGQEEIHHTWSRPRIKLTDTGTFNQAADPQADKNKQAQQSSEKPPKQHSHGVKDVKALAKLLDATQFDKGQRQSILMRNGAQTTTLEEIYNNNKIDLYRSLFKDETEIAKDPYANHNHMALFRFRPNIERFWRKEKDGSTSVPSYPEYINDKDGDKFEVVTLLNFQTETALNKLKETAKGATGDERWFLVYSEHATINRDNFVRKKHDLSNSDEDHAKVHIRATVSNEAQIMQWQPRSPQINISFDNTIDSEPNEAPVIE